MLIYCDLKGGFQNENKVIVSKKREYLDLLGKFYKVRFYSFEFGIFSRGIFPNCQMSADGKKKDEELSSFS